MKIGIIAITKQGCELAGKLQTMLPGSTCYASQNQALEGMIIMDQPLKIFCGTLFNNYDALIFIMSTGIVVRSIAAHLKSKTSDPAVLVMDEKATNVISLLSGHLGGANALTERVASLLNSNPVITTASDVNNLPSVDMIAKEYNLVIDSMKDAKIITAMMVNRETVVLVDDYQIVPKDILPKVEGEVKGKLIISNRKGLNENLPFAKLIPRNIVLGVGCKRDTNPQALTDFIINSLNDLNIEKSALTNIASIDVKADEPAILNLEKVFGIQPKFYSADELKEVDYLFEGSDFVRQTVGVGAVSESAAYLAGNKEGEFIARRLVKDGMTLSVFLMINV